jgi:hypothetical protein
MVAPLLIPIVSLLMEKGMGLLSKAVEVKGREAVEKIIGTKLPDTAAELTPEVAANLREKEMEHEEELLRLAIEKAKVDLEDKRIDVTNTQGARDMNLGIQQSSNADHIAKVAAYYIDFIIVLATVGMIAIIFFVGVPTENKELAYMALGSLLTMCGTILNFHRGTSSGSKSKDAAIHSVLEGGVK